MTEEYRRKEQEFMDRHDSLCEDVSPDLCDCSACPTRDLCDCSACPTRDLCKWLYDNHPYPINNPFA